MAGRRKHVISFVLLVLGLVAIAGCGSDNKSNEAPAELEDQLGFGRDGIMERQARVENAIRGCMRQQGFDYVPVDPFAQQQALTGKARQSEEDFMKEFGYGITTLYGRGNQGADPNQRIRASLGSADQRAYDRALGGDNPTVTFSEAVDSGDFSELGGCTKQATESVFGGAATLTALVGRLDELDEQIIQDGRMVKAREEWSVCMADKGFRYEEPDAIDEDLTKRFRAIVGGNVRPGATKAEPGATYDKAALTQLQSEEVKIAAADVQCEKEKIVPVEKAVRPQYEKTFREENRSLLTRVRPLGGS
jgi:hypothetical protein